MTSQPFHAGSPNSQTFGALIVDGNSEILINTVLTADQVFNHVYYLGGNNLDIQLPQTASPYGQHLYIINDSFTGCTVTAAVGENINGAASHNLTPGTIHHIISYDAGEWRAEP